MLGFWGQKLPFLKGSIAPPRLKIPLLGANSCAAEAQSWPDGSSQLTLWKPNVALREPNKDLPKVNGYLVNALGSDRSRLAYQEAALDLAIDYARPPEPPEEQMAWIATLS